LGDEVVGKIEVEFFGTHFSASAYWRPGKLQVGCKGVKLEKGPPRP